MLKPQTTGSVVCPDCGRLVGVRDERCFNCGRWNPGLWGYAPLLGKLGRDFGFTQLVVGGCSLLWILSLVWDFQGIGGGGILGLLSPSGEALFLFGASGSIPVFQFGRWWTVLSAGWLHGGLLHILFNMMWLRDLLPVMFQLYGVGRTVIIYTAGGIAGFAATTGMALVGLPGPLRGAQLTIGASAALFGLFGAFLAYSRRTGSSMLGQQAVRWVIIGLVLGILIPIMDNWAHLGGFAGGYLASRWLDPAREETPMHLLGGLACLVLTAISLVVSILHGLPLVQGG